MKEDDLTVSDLHLLGLNDSEAVIYIELLKNRATHAQLSARTNINRTTLYRLVASLEKQGLVTTRTDDTGKFLVASDPSNLEADIITREQQTKQQRETFTRLLPALEQIRKGTEADFALFTYEGIEGFKRMLWHELKTQDECLCYGVGAIEDLVPDRRWVEQHRQKIIEAGYGIREILNDPCYSFTNHTTFDALYQQRVVDRKILPMNHLITIYNDTVATYNVYEGRRVGLEVVSSSYANTMRHNFEHFWQIATPIQIRQ